MVAFGGAYAVLACVGDAAESAYGWLKPGEMLDGLALAETTPGPLVLVLTFVRFRPAYANATGVSPPVGFIGAALTTWVTFVPCFLRLFLGSPYIERLRGNRRLAAGLAAITAAVVGVTLSLAIFLGLHVLFREVGQPSWAIVRPALPVWSTIDPLALLLFAVAAVALFRFKFGILRTLPLSCMLGVVLKQLT